MNNPNQEALAGQIVLGQNNKNRRRKTVHPMVYLGEVPQQSALFFGVMLTSSSRYSNISIPYMYFETLDEQGSPYGFPTMETYFRPRLMHKKLDWRPFKVIGKLTEDGLAHINSIVGGQAAIFYKYNT